jgi:hypothetical protein
MSVGAEGWELLQSYFRILPVLKMLVAKYWWRLSVGPSGRTALPCLRRSYQRILMGNKMCFVLLTCWAPRSLRVGLFLPDSFSI